MTGQANGTRPTTPVAPAAGVVGSAEPTGDLIVDGARPLPIVLLSAADQSRRLVANDRFSAPAA